MGDIRGDVFYFRKLLLMGGLYFLEVWVSLLFIGFLVSFDFIGSLV